MAHRPPLSIGLLLVALEKLVETTLLLAAFAGLHHLLHGNAAKTLVGWMEAVRVDPDSKYARLFLASFTTASPEKLSELRVGTLLYGMVYGVEGVGLLLRQRWAEYVTILTTAGFLPLEGLELIHHASTVKVLVTIGNVLVVIYLIMRVWKTSGKENA